MMSTRERLTSDGQPVTVTTDPERPCWVRVELDGMAMEWTTDTDASTPEDMEELRVKEVHAREALWEEAERLKLGQAVRQALAVAYALHASSTVTQAWDMLGLEYTLEDVDATEGHRLAQDVAQARAVAWGLVAAQLRTYGWVRHGDALGLPQHAVTRRVLDLLTGEVWEVQEHVMERNATLKETEGGGPILVRERVIRWTDANGVPLSNTEALRKAGEWWCPPGTLELALPWDPWEMERRQMV